MSVDATPAYVWGYNNTGELGLGHAARVFRPLPARLPAGIVDVQCGANFTIALTFTGEVWSWGGNVYGQLGDGTTQPRRKPRRVTLPSGFRAAGIAAGTNHVVVVSRTGHISTWGRNHRGQLGIGHHDDHPSPQLVATKAVKSVSAGNGISAAITRDGQLLSWGRNSAHQLALTQSAGDNKDVVRPTRSHAISAAVAAVDSGLRHQVVLTVHGQVYVFGMDAFGRSVSGRVALSPGWGTVRKISVGDDHVLALTSRGLVLTWGANDLGQLGLGDREHRRQPVMVRFPRAIGLVTSILAGHRHNLICTDLNEVYAWGGGGFGSVGVGEPPPTRPSNYPTPQRVPGLSGLTGTRLGGGGYTSMVFVDHGPAAGLQLDPPEVSVVAGHPVRFQVNTVDVFGTRLATPPRRLKVAADDAVVSNATSTGATVTAQTPGAHIVRAFAGGLTGHAILHVKGR